MLSQVSQLLGTIFERPKDEVDRANLELAIAQSAAAKEIKRLREKAERLRGKKSVVTRLNEAVALKAWTDELRAQLPAQLDKMGATSSEQLVQVGTLLRLVYLSRFNFLARAPGGIAAACTGQYTPSRLQWIMIPTGHYPS